jgi:hypothetical protein
MELFKYIRSGIAAVIVSAAVPLLIILQSCGGSSGGSSDYAGGGIGGTGKGVGTITAFGSIFVNAVEHSTSGIPITVDGAPASEDDLDIGMKVVLSTRNGQASSVEYDPDLAGPVQNIDLAAGTFTVLGQTVIVDSTTAFKDVADLAGLSSGDLVEVSGFNDSAGRLRATYIRRDSSIQMFSLEGTVSNHDAGAKRFSLGSIDVDYSGVSSPPSFGNDSYIEVKGSLAGNTLIASSLELDSPLPAASSGEELEIEGIITSVTSFADFRVNGQRVLTTTGTEFEHGASSDIQIDNEVEVEGTVDSAGNLVAEKIEFRFNESREMKLEGRVSDLNTANSTVTVFGIRVSVTGSTSMKDESSQHLRSFSLSDISPGDFLEIGGFVDSSGTVVASSLEREDAPGSGNDKLKGPVDLNSENGTSSLGILGITVDVTGATFRDADDNPINASQFFDAIDDTTTPGDIVKVKGAYTGGSSFTASEAEIERIN